MKNNRPKEFSNSQIERLEFIEFCLDFYGRVSRQDLMLCFQLATASCTRDLALYRELAPDNLEMRHQDKAYYRTENFQSIFLATAKKSLANIARYGCCLSHGFQFSSSNLMFNLDISLEYPAAKTIAEVNRAIVGRRVINIEYQSLKLGRLSRDIAPQAIFNGYRGWYVRAYDYTSSCFCDFSLSTIRCIEIPLSAASLAETPRDNRWNTPVTFSLIPHPSVSNKIAVELMYQMTDGSLLIETNEVIASHILKRENVEILGSNSNDNNYLLSLKSEVEINLAVDEL